MEVELLSLSRQIETLNKRPPEEVLGILSPCAAKDLRRSLNRLSIALESPGDIVDRIVYSVSAFHRQARDSLHFHFLDVNVTA